ncbi:MAG TPA: hypothetical protein VGQ46_04895 [Thermoanaerobaculia bacterium]|jgi:hypothetical protein|nr:hypothetical protein [Thermoanaerobaculia bacterium]
MYKLLFAVLSVFAAASTASGQWSQFGGNARHSGSSGFAGQSMVRVLADVVHDAMVPDELRVGSGSLNVHYSSPLLSGDDVFMVYKTANDLHNSPPGNFDLSLHRLSWENAGSSKSGLRYLSRKPV